MALQIINQKLVYSKVQQDKWEIVKDYCNLSEIHMLIGNYEEAQQCLDYARKIFAAMYLSKLDSLYLTINWFTGQLLVKTCKFNEALTLYTQTLELLKNKSGNNEIEEAEIYS